MDEFVNLWPIVSGVIVVAALAVDTRKGIASSEEVRNRQVKSTDAPQAKAPAAKRIYTEEEIASATKIAVLIADEDSSEKLREEWEKSPDLLEVIIDGKTLRQTILDRKAALDARA